MSSVPYVDEEDVAVVRKYMQHLHTFTPAQYINDHTLNRPLDRDDLLHIRRSIEQEMNGKLNTMLRTCRVAAHVEIFEAGETTKERPRDEWEDPTISTVIQFEPIFGLRIHAHLLPVSHASGKLTAG